MLGNQFRYFLLKRYIIIGILLTKYPCYVGVVNVMCDLQRYVVFKCNPRNAFIKS